MQYFPFFNLAFNKKIDNKKIQKTMIKIECCLKECVLWMAIYFLFTICEKMLGKGKYGTSKHF